LVSLTTSSVSIRRPSISIVVADGFQIRLLSEEPMMVALPEGHAIATQKEIYLAMLKDEPFLLFPWEIGPTLYDGIVAACEAAGFDPKISQLGPTLASVVNLVAAALGVLIVPGSLSQVRPKGVAYRQIAGQIPTARLALAYRRGETSPVVRNFIARAVS
jgi:DNA-binding transcriptional LysR family regulator